MEEILNRVNAHHNELVLMPGAQIGRLVGLLDGDDDYYYIIRNQHKRSVDVNEFSLWSCVGDPYYLKGVLPEHVYNEADGDAELGGASKEPAPLRTTSSTSHCAES